MEALTKTWTYKLPSLNARKLLMMIVISFLMSFLIQTLQSFFLSTSLGPISMLTTFTRDLKLSQAIIQLWISSTGLFLKIHWSIFGILWQQARSFQEDSCQFSWSQMTCFMSTILDMRMVWKQLRTIQSTKNFTNRSKTIRHLSWGMDLSEKFYKLKNLMLNIELHRGYIFKSLRSLCLFYSCQVITFWFL